MPSLEKWGTACPPLASHSPLRYTSFVSLSLAVMNATHSRRGHYVTPSVCLQLAAHALLAVSKTAQLSVDAAKALAFALAN